MDFKSQNILKGQNKLFYAVFAVVVALALLVFYGFMPENKNSISVPQRLELPGDNINPQEIWMSRLESENKLLKNQLTYLEKTIVEMKKSDSDNAKDNDDFKKEISSLKSELKNALANKTVKENQPAPSDFKTNAKPFLPAAPLDFKTSAKPFLASEDPFLPLKNNSNIDMTAIPVKPIFKELSVGRGKRNVSNVDQAIPAGTSVQALLVSSVDAPCGLFSKSDPQPLKLRLLDDAHLPKAVRAKIKGALVIASAYGDISTERVYIRLERLTKVESNGEFIETSVTGYVSGEDGKFGVRGVVVDKSEKVVSNAAKSGFLGGISSILQSAVSKHDVNQFSVDLVKQGCAGGASTVFDMLAEYYIRRAEQIMPVIQLTAGRVVDITFTHQAELGDLYTKERVKEIRDNSRRAIKNEQASVY